MAKCEASPSKAFKCRCFSSKKYLDSELPGFLEIGFQISECFQGNLFNLHCVQMLTNLIYT